MSEFILMLTRDDVTVADAAELFDEVAATGLRHVGFKDVGLPVPEMQQLVASMHDRGKSVHLEVVSLSEADELRSARTAIDLGVDYLIGGTRWEAVSELIAGTGIRYMPYVGEVVGHPAELRGNADEMIEAARSRTDRVDGINLLAFRHRGVDGIELLRDVVDAVELPVICAGSINSLERVKAVAATGTWAFTIGTALLDGDIVPGAGLAEQTEAVLAAATA